MQRPEDLEAQVERGRLADIYVLSGPAEFLIDRFVRRLAERSGAARRVVEAAETKPEEVLAVHLVQDLFATARVIQIQGFSAWSTKQRKDFLAAIVGHVPPGIRVVLTSDAKKPSAAKLPEGVESAFYWNPFPSVLPKLAEGFLRDHGGKPGRGVGESLVERYGNDLRRIDQEAFKLAALGKGGTVTSELVARHCQAASGALAYQVAAVFTSRRRTQALSELRDLLSSEEPHALLAILAGRLRRMVVLRGLEARDSRRWRDALDVAARLVEAEETPGRYRMQAKQRTAMEKEVEGLLELLDDEARKDLEGVFPRQLPALVEHASRFSAEELAKGLAACARADRRLKGEGGDLELVMEELALVLTRAPRGR